MYELLRSLLARRMREFTEEIFMEIAMHFSLRNVERKETMVRAGNAMRYLYFVNRGCLRTFWTKRNGDEITADFAFEGEFNLVTPEFLLKKPGNYHLQALEKSELLAISSTSFEYLALKYVHFYQSIFYMTYIKRQELHRETFLCSSVKKYQWLQKNRPQIIARVSDKLIASYLGISQRTLIRAKHSLR